MTCRVGINGSCPQWHCSLLHKLCGWPSLLGLHSLHIPRATCNYFPNECFLLDCSFQMVCPLTAADVSSFKLPDLENWLSSETVFILCPGRPSCLGYIGRIWEKFWEELHLENLWSSQPLHNVSQPSANLNSQQKFQQTLYFTLQS